MIEWWRSWHGAPTDPKWAVIARVSGAPRAIVVSLAWALLDAASRASVRGDVSGADPEELAVALDVQPEQIAAIMAAMRATNPTTGKPRFLTADGRIDGWSRHQPKREREDDRDRSGRGVAVAEDGASVAGDGGAVAGRGGTMVGDGGTAAPPAPPKDSRKPESPLTPTPFPPDFAAKTDRVRMLVWSKAGMSDQAIQTKLVSSDTAGLRQVHGWFELGLSEERIVAAVSRAFSEATSPIRKPWPYLDAVMRAEAERPADAPAGSAGSASGFVSTSVDWRKRLSDFQRCGFWLDGWGPRPGEAGCEAPADLLAAFGF